MFITWIIRIVILSGGFLFHWGLGLFLVITLFFYMKNKAKIYDQHYNLGIKIRDENGRIIKAPWYIF